jgi:hypothetical protein
MSERIVLQTGAHRSLDDGGCVMEFAAWVAGEPHSDHPQCVSPVLAIFLRDWNDALDDATRQRLVPYAIAAVGTNTGQTHEETRAWLALDWLIRVYTPAWLRLAGLVPEARTLEATARIVDAVTCRAVQRPLDAAGAAARAAARAAAGDAAWAAAWAAARAAARDAAGDAAWAAAWAAARAAARDAARAAAWAAARAALEPTVKMLQESAFELLDAMIAVGRREVAMSEERVAFINAGAA